MEVVAVVVESWSKGCRLRLGFNLLYEGKCTLSAKRQCLCATKDG